MEIGKIKRNLAIVQEKVQSQSDSSITEPREIQIVLKATPVDQNPQARAIFEKEVIAESDLSISQDKH